MKDLSVADGNLIDNKNFPGLLYDQDSGLFYRNSMKKSSGTNVHGYIRLMFNCKMYAAHRLAWYFVYGRWPINQIDHINGIRNDNRIENLREAFQTENQWNARIRVDNSSGVKNVTWHKRVGKWMVQIMKEGKRTRKYFSSLEDAKIWASNYREKHHGDFFRNE